MKVLILNRLDAGGGGAATAAYRLHRAFMSSGIDSRMLVSRASRGDWTVEGPQTSLGKFLPMARSELGQQFSRILKTDNKILHSVNIFRSAWPTRINRSDADVVNLHWVNGEMLSIKDVTRINKPIVWTFHDMWAFCGAEHVTDDTRWKDGYTKHNRPSHESLFDLNRWTWNRKRRHWKQPFQIVTPSSWLAELVRSSVLFNGWPVEVIPNPIDTQVWKPIEKMIAKDLMGLPRESKVVLFGAYSGTKCKNKGFDLLEAALHKLAASNELRDVRLVVFGQSPPREIPKLGFPISFIGTLHDELSLKVTYSCADVTVIPSRIENLPTTAVESLACGTPVVGFGNHGLRDIVQHRVNGYLAIPYDTDDLANGIKHVISNPILASKSWQSVATRFDSLVIADLYKHLFDRVVSE